MSFIAVLLLTPGSLSAKTNGRIPTIDAFVQERMVSLNIPGAAIAIVRDGEMVHLARYGRANETGAPT